MNITQVQSLSFGNVGTDETALAIPDNLTGIVPTSSIRKIFVSCTLADNANDKRIKLQDFSGTFFDSGSSLNGQTGKVFFVFDYIVSKYFLSIWKDDSPLFARLVNGGSTITLRIQGEENDDLVVTDVLVNDSPLFS